MRLQDLVTRIGLGGGADRRGSHEKALDELIELNRRDPRPELEVRLVDLRHEAASHLSSTGRSPWPPAYDDPFPDVVGSLPEVPRAELSADMLGGAVAHHGALVVRGLFDDEQVARGLDAVHRAEVLRDAGRRPSRRPTVGTGRSPASRAWTTDCGPSWPSRAAPGWPTPPLRWPRCSTTSPRPGLPP